MGRLRSQKNLSPPAPPVQSSSTPGVDYYPPAWDRQRFLNADRADLATLAENQIATMREGLRAELGEQAFEEYFEEMWRRTKLREGIPEPEVGPPNFMMAMSRHAHGKKDDEWPEWGFVGFRATYGDEDAWGAFLKRFGEVLDETFDFYASVKGMAEVRAKFRVRWIEDPALDGAAPQEIGNRFRGMEHTDCFFPHSLCLSVTQKALESVLTSPMPASAKLRWRPQIPFVLAVAAECGERIPNNPGDEDEEEAGDNFRGYFNVAVESLLDELFTIVVTDMSAPYEFGAFVKGEDIWRSGIGDPHPAYVGN
ncbi:hypothetical protein FIBSPDRAFT_817236 [Athelia psychrophila]|uniref:Uncharacterized protein n=1 Tax=Athelia psychrophila TaxID=1759441 RepID=A0A166RKG2_9AGAM|nr:hypothetical protein FIBSPDRAFT_817236 [Fibularhizoctonia sp. CBS 109695]